MNPYETDPTAISPSDLYGDSPLYGRYVPHGDDFQPDLQHSNSTSPESLKYWESILESCDWSNRLHHISGARDVFALGSVIVKSGHLSNYTLPCDHSLADQNEVSAVALVREVLEGLGIQVPMIYFAGKVRTFDVYARGLHRQANERGLHVASGMGCPYRIPHPRCHSQRCMAVSFERSESIF